MIPRIYFETNWIIGAVFGQDSHPDAFLSSAPTGARKVLPAACLMEAISAFDRKRIERNQLKSEVERQLKQVERSSQIPAAQDLAAQLIQAKLTNDRLLSDLFQRLDDVLIKVVSHAELVPVSAAIVEHMIQLRRQTELDRDDALILASILSHAEGEPTARRALLTENIRDFGVEPVKKLLEEKGIQLFSSTARVLQWAAE